MTTAVKSSKKKTTAKKKRKTSLFMQQVRVFQRSLVEKALAKNNGNQLHTAETLGVHRAFLSRLIKTLKPSGKINRKPGHPVSA